MKTLFALGMLILFTTQAQGAGLRACDERTKMIKAFKKKYGELPKGMGVSTSGKSVYEILTSEKGTWSIIMSLPNGTTCIMAAGKHWRDKKQIFGKDT